MFLDGDRSALSSYQFDNSEVLTSVSRAEPLCSLDHLWHWQRTADDDLWKVDKNGSALCPLRESLILLGHQWMDVMLSLSITWIHYYIETASFVAHNYAQGVAAIRKESCDFFVDSDEDWKEQCWRSRLESTRLVIVMARDSEITISWDRGNGEDVTEQPIGCDVVAVLSLSACGNGVMMELACVTCRQQFR